MQLGKRADAQSGGWVWTVPLYMITLLVCTRTKIQILHFLNTVLTLIVMFIFALRQRSYSEKSNDALWSNRTEEVWGAVSQKHRQHIARLQQISSGRRLGYKRRVIILTTLIQRLGAIRSTYWTISSAEFSQVNRCDSKQTAVPYELLHLKIPEQREIPGRRLNPQLAVWQELVVWECIRCKQFI